MKPFTTILLLLTFAFPAFGQGLSPCNGGTYITYQGYEYDIVEIGNQCWFSENLRNELYANGDVIPANLNDEEWDGATEGAMTIYGEGTSTVYSGSSDEIENLDTYGRLYNWYAVNDVRSLCPSGWSLPLLTDLEELVNHLGGGSTALELLTGNSSSSGFDGLFGGRRTALGSFYYEGTEGSFWSATPNIDANNDGLNLILCSNCEEPFWDSTSKKVGYSVRCIKSEGTVLELGCTDPEATNYDPTATADDGSCTYPPGPCNNATSITYQGYDYDIVEIGNRCWFQQNLNITSFSNGDEIPFGNDVNLWMEGATSSPLQCAPYFEEEVADSIGRHYNWFSIMDSRNVCPQGWHVPLKSEYESLESQFAPFANSAIKDDETWDGTNESGYTALLTGYLVNGGFQSEWYSTMFWYQNTPQEALWLLTDANSGGQEDFFYMAEANGIEEEAGYFVRCIMDSIIPGCTVEQACNFNLFATEDDGSCLFVGESCDDGDDTTFNDTIMDDCSCQGEVIEGCTYAVACNYDALATVFDGSCLFPGDSCDDGDSETINDSLNDDCECAGEPGISGCLDEEACNFNAEANADDGSCAYAGDSCDDGNEFTENDVYSDDCECSGTEVEIVPGCVYATACNYNPEANQDDMSCLFPGDSCDDEDVTTGNDTYTEDCECVGEPLIGGCTYESACNFNPDAQFDDSSCIFIGDSCDDGDSETENDVINMDCDCVGTPITSVSEVGLATMTVYPNPVSNQLTIELGTRQGTSVLVKIFDSQGKLVFDENRTGTFVIDVSTYNTGVYSISVESESELIKAQFLVE